RGLAVFDLSTGLFIPFLLATSCVVIAAASQFHARPEPGLIQVHQAGSETEVSAKLKKNYEANLTKMLTATTAGFADFSGEKKTEAMATLPEADRILAATLIKRDAFALANSLEGLAGKTIAQYVFGIGVVGMAISSIIILMLINGFTICEILDKPSSGMLHRLGCYMPGVTGVIGALFLWSGEAKFYLAVPTSRFGMVLLPIAYIAFFCLMNNRKLLGDAMPKGGKRVAWNGLMGIGVILAMIGASISILNDKAKLPGSEIMVKHIALGLVAALVVLAVVIQFTRAPVTTGESRSPEKAGEEGE
ncbi:MAG: divalent metal cation transporter, partial [Planctomycetota bacterium]|nr:divalent metal cation transporter [Planctomycetota bacterium]